MSVDLIGLMACPMCGGDPVMFRSTNCDEDGNPHDVFGIRCTKCATATTHLLKSKDAAANSWNKRTKKEIAPCPFCGNGNCISSVHTIETSDEWIEDRWFVECLQCFAHNDKKKYKTRDEAIEAWNRRCE